MSDHPGMPTDRQSQALEHLRMALVYLDEADEMQAPPYVQMAIDILEELREDAPAPRNAA